MTRYARAKGSKASNEKLPNEATPWHVMKQQIEENKEVLGKKKSAKELLKDRDDILENTNKNVNHNWAEFNDNKSKSDTKKHKKSKSTKTRTNFVEDSKNDILPNSNNAETEKTKIETINKSDKVSNEIKPDVNNSHLSCNEKESRVSQNDRQSSILSKRQKRNRKRKLETSDDKSKKDVSGKSDKVQEKKIKERGEYKRRKPNAGVTKIIINGVETEITMYDGFPVKKEDAQRLAELKQKLIMKGKYIHITLNIMNLSFE